MSMKRVLKKGIAATGAVALVCGMPFTALAEDVPQEAQNSVMGYNVRDSWLVNRSTTDSENYGFNIHGVGENGEYIQSTYSDSCYDTYVNDASRGATTVNNGAFAYGQEYISQGIGTTITPRLTDDAVILDYTMRNTTDADQTFRVGSVADIMIGRDDHATIYGDANSFTMTDGTTAIRVNVEDPFDNLWYGYYGDVRSHFADTAIRTDELSNVDSGVAWGWNVTLAPGQTAVRAIGARIGDATVVTTEPAPVLTVPTPEPEPTPVVEEPAPEPVVLGDVVEEPAPAVEEPAVLADIVTAPVAEVVEREVDNGWGPAPEKAPKVWRALTENGQALPITNMGVAEAKTATLYVDLGGTTSEQYKDVVMEDYTKAPAGGVFVIGTTKVSVVDREMCEKFATRSDVTIELVFPYGEHVYLVKVPAGYDYKTVLDESGFAGYLKLASIFGSQVIG